METFLLVIHLLVAIALIGVILLQRTAQDGGGIMGGSSTMGGIFTVRGSANVLTKATSILAAMFIATSLGLGVLASMQHSAQIAPAAEAPAPAAKEKPASDVPVTP